jgi:transposase
MARNEVITGTERRRRWSEEQKRAIAVESLAPGAVVSEVARRADVRPSQINRWRQESHTVADGLAQVLIAPLEHALRAADGAACTGPVIEIEFAGRARLRIPAAIPAAVIKALSRR